MIPLLIYEALRGLLEVVLGAAGAEVATPIVAGAAALIVGLHYSRELSRILVGAARVVSIASAVLFGIGVLVLVGIATGWISIEGGVIGDVLRVVGGLAGFGGSH